MESIVLIDEGIQRAVVKPQTTTGGKMIRRSSGIVLVALLLVLVLSAQAFATQTPRSEDYSNPFLSMQSWLDAQQREMNYSLYRSARQQLADLEQGPNQGDYMVPGTPRLPHKGNGYEPSDPNDPAYLQVLLSKFNAESEAIFSQAAYDGLHRDMSMGNPGPYTLVGYDEHNNVIETTTLNPFLSPSDPFISSLEFSPARYKGADVSAWNSSIVSSDNFFWNSPGMNEWRKERSDDMALGWARDEARGNQGLAMWETPDMSNFGPWASGAAYGAALDNASEKSAANAPSGTFYQDGQYWTSDYGNAPGGGDAGSASSQASSPPSADMQAWQNRSTGNDSLDFANAAHVECSC